MLDVNKSNKLQDYMILEGGREDKKVLNQSWNLTSLQSLHLRGGYWEKWHMTWHGNIQLANSYRNTLPLILNIYFKSDLCLFNQESYDTSQTSFPIKLGNSLKDQLSDKTFSSNSENKHTKSFSSQGFLSHIYVSKFSCSTGWEMEQGGNKTTHTRYVLNCAN